MPDTQGVREAYRELRLGLVFNGGVSLAVWMGGVCKELDRFRCALHSDSEALAPYRALLDAVRTDVVTDVISGTSAGGINGVMLGYCVANGKSLEGSDPNRIRERWRTLADVDALLTSQGDPQSALEGRRLLQGCADVFGVLSSAAADLHEDASREVRLTVTATDSAGYEVHETPDAVTGADDVNTVDHRLEMRFRHIDRPSGIKVKLSDALRDAIAHLPGTQKDAAWPFPEQNLSRSLVHAEAPSLLTRAARTTASFPIAFSPSELPLDHESHGLGGAAPDLTATPKMRDVIVRRGGEKPSDQLHSLYGVDGGLWDNAPFEAVLRNIDRMPSARDVARRLVYVMYTPPLPPVAESGGEPELLRSFVQALALPSSVSFANDLERIRADMAQQDRRHESFRWLLSLGISDVCSLATRLLPTFPSVPRGLTVLDPATGLDTWHATPEDWQWGLLPSRTSIEEARGIVRTVLRAAATAGADVTTWVETREQLSQLAWVLSDLADVKADDAAAAPIWGQVMHDFAAIVSPLNERLHAFPGVSDDALALSADGPETIVKRAIALEVCLHALAADRRRHRVDYRPATIRPSERWPDGTPGRPLLAGIRYGHFGGFLRQSWRLSDWMWGRLDGSRRMIDMLLDDEQVKRLTLGAPPETIPEIAGQLAAVAGDPSLTDEFAATITAVAGGTDVGLQDVRSALQRTFRRAILQEELKDVASAIISELGENTLELSQLGAGDDAALRTVVTALPHHVRPVDLSQYGERAAANVMQALKHPKVAQALRSLATVERKSTAFWHTIRAAAHYVRHRVSGWKP